MFGYSYRTGQEALVYYPMHRKHTQIRNSLRIPLRFSSIGDNYSRIPLRLTRLRLSWTQLGISLLGGIPNEAPVWPKGVEFPHTFPHSSSLELGAYYELKIDMVSLNCYEKFSLRYSCRLQRYRKGRIEEDQHEAW